MNDDVQTDRETRRKRDEELMLRRLNFLPEIKKEIQYYLGISQTQRQSANLQKTLSLLEKHVDLSEVSKVNDIQKIGPIFGHFERIKSIARVEVLAIRTNLELGLRDWALGKQILRNEGNLRAGEFTVVDLWAANIIPDTHSLNFQLPARITVAHCDSGYRIAFGLATSLDDFSSSIFQVELSKDWVDPLIEALHNLDLFQTQSEKVLSLNGIVYELYTRSHAGESLIEFINPYFRGNQSMIEIEWALFKVAKILVNELGGQPEKDFLSIWQRCLAKTQNA